MKENVPTSVRFDEVTKTRLLEISKRSGIPVKQVIEMSVRWFLHEVQTKGAVPLLPPAETKKKEAQK
jgi:hypothetical protein